MSYFKWVGSKNKRKTIICDLFPSNFKNFYDVFCGSCSIFFEIAKRDLTQNIKREYFLTDTNPHLINFHLVVKNYLSDLQKYSKQFEYCDSLSLFNELKPLNNINESDIGQEIKAAFRFIFLVKRSYGGIWRVNKNNIFNAPYDKTQKSLILHKDIELYSKLLQMANIECKDYRNNNSGTQDLIFIDPPYYPLSKTANFTQYTKNKWNEQDHNSLIDYINTVHKNSSYFIMTNNHCDYIYNQCKNFNYYIDNNVGDFLKKETKRNKKIESIVCNFEPKLNMFTKIES